eukprot:CAMPEP_0184494610 /NCGR_PEP_ID=MMETSP0113_2-20130426/29119_1 /TAXON_ID=91329 /ORGANISM="Norrisiella sphaerica, Strain BC52" /LENGTH=242 /DNA_ID=CAMNT_0026880429 /DNA_START=283 /DNA_END=1008 /DNA_ORIENTATION=-
MQIGFGSRGKASMGLVKLFFETLRREGPVGLYRGILPPASTAAIKSGAMLMAKAWWCRRLEPFNRFDANTRTDYLVLSVAGALTGVSVTPLHVISDLVKIRMQGSMASDLMYNTTASTIQTILRNEGWSALTVGTTATTLRYSSAFSVLFSGYDLIVSMIYPNGKPSGTAALFAGSVMGAVSWTISLPWDVVKTRMQMNPNLYPHFVDTCRDITKKEGIVGFYRGYSAVITRAVVLNATFFW